jgi:hypothetical protein
MVMSLSFPQGVARRVPLASEVRAKFAYGIVIDEAVAARRRLTVPRLQNLASSYRTAQPRTLLVGVWYA